MSDDDYLTLAQASSLCGRSKREMRALVLSGQIPAVRHGNRWRVARAELARSQGSLSNVAGEAPGKQATDLAVVQESPAARSEMLLILEMLREKDEQIARLQEDRVRLSGQVGYLQAQVQERDARLRLVEAAAIESGARRLLPQAVDTHAPDADVPGSSAPDDRVPASEGSAKVPAASNGQEYNETVTALSATPSTGPEASAQPGLHAESGVAVPPDRSGEAVGLEVPPEPATTHAADTSSVQEGPQPDAAATTPGDASADLGNKNLAETALGQDRSTRTRTEMPQPAAGPAKPVEPGDRETAGDGAVIARAGGAQTPEAELDPSRVTAGPRHPMTPRPLLAWPNENKRSAEAAGSAHTAARTPRKRDTLQSQARAGVERLRRFFQRER